MMYKNLQIWELNYTQKDDIQFKRIHREELWFVTCPLPPLPPKHTLSPFTMGQLFCPAYAFCWPSYCSVGFTAAVSLGF